MSTVVINYALCQEVCKDKLVYDYEYCSYKLASVSGGL